MLRESTTGLDRQQKKPAPTITVRAGLHCGAASLRSMSSAATVDCSEH